MACGGGMTAGVTAFAPFFRQSGEMLRPGEVCRLTSLCPSFCARSWVDGSRSVTSR